MSEVLFRKVNKKYPDSDGNAVEPLDITIKDKEFMVLIGPSGCGKSTILRMIAGLEDITNGEIIINDKVVNDIEPKNRNIAMVFQNYALYPHMKVKDNIAFPLTQNGMKKKKAYEKVNEVSKILQLEEYLERKPSNLSGGQRQRVALGRAMVRNPDVFLLDEPLSNLDAKLRVELRAGIVKLHKQLNTTFIYVTHDQDEAMTMGDRIMVLNKGKLEQVDSPMNLFNNPASKFVAEFIGSPKMNVFPTALTEKSGELYYKLDGSYYPVADIVSDRLTKNVSEAYIGIRPEMFNLVDRPTENSFKVTIENMEVIGYIQHIYFSIPESDKHIQATISTRLPVNIGDMVHLEVNSKYLYMFDMDTELSILREVETH